MQREIDNGNTLNSRSSSQSQFVPNNRPGRQSEVQVTNNNQLLQIDPHASSNQPSSQAPSEQREEQIPRSQRNGLLDIINIEIGANQSQNLQINDISNLTLEQLEQMFCINQYSINAIKEVIYDVVLDITHTQILLFLLVFSLGWDLDMQISVFYMIFIDIVKIFRINYQSEREFIEQQYKSINLYHYGFSIVAEGVIIAYLNGCLDSMIISSLILVASQIHQVFMIKRKFKTMQAKSQVMSFVNESLRMIIYIQFLLFYLKYENVLSSPGWTVYFIPTLVTTVVLGLLNGFILYLIIRQIGNLVRSSRKNYQAIKSILWIFMNSSYSLISLVLFYCMITNYLRDDGSNFQHSQSKTYHIVYVIPLLLVFYFIVYWWISDDTILFFGKVICKQDFFYEDRQIRQAIEDRQYQQIQQQKKNQYIVNEKSIKTPQFISQASSNLFKPMKNPFTIEYHTPSKQKEKPRCKKMKNPKKSAKNASDQKNPCQIQIININYTNNNNINIVNQNCTGQNCPSDKNEPGAKFEDRRSQTARKKCQQDQVTMDLPVNQSHQIIENPSSNRSAEQIPDFQSLQHMFTEEMPPPGSKDLNQSRENQDECCICYENQANTVIDSCFHGGICYECGLDLMKTKGCCYMCRKPIVKLLKYDRCKKTRDGLYPIIIETNVEAMKNSVRQHEEEINSQN